MVCCNSSWCVCVYVCVCVYAPLLSAPHLTGFFLENLTRTFSPGYLKNWILLLKKTRQADVTVIHLLRTDFQIVLQFTWFALLSLVTKSSLMLLLVFAANVWKTELFLFFCSSPVSQSTPADTWETTAVLRKKAPLFHCYYVPSHLYFSSWSSWLQALPLWQFLLTTRWMAVLY